MNTTPQLTRHTAVWLVLTALALPAGQLSTLAQDNVPVSPKAAANRVGPIRAADARVARGAPPVAPTALDEVPEPAEPPEPPEPPEPDDSADSGPEWQGELRRAQAEVGRAMKDVQHHLAGMRLGFNGADATRLLVVPDGKAGEAGVSQTREDLAVMSHILQRALDPEKPRRNSNFLFELDGWHGGARRDLDAMQLDGFGAVFLLDVDYPLVAPPDPAAKPDAPKAAADTTWEKARRELSGAGDEDHDADADDDEAPRRSGPPYDAERVAKLRQRLTECLKHAANLRALTPAQSVVVIVTGRAPAADRAGGRTIYNMDPKLAARYGLMPKAEADAAGGRGATSVMTLRVKKTAVDDFAAGKLTAEQFAREVNVTERIDRNVPERLDNPPVPAKPETRKF